jgi:predicted membrane-bound mannosyltransferase/DNA-binding beta-propeller fold protein YncE
MMSIPKQVEARAVEEPIPWLKRPLIDQLPFVTPELLIVSAIMLLAVFSRFYILGDRVMSHDETNHVVPSYSLYQGQGYAHDPVTHGPFQFHIVALTYFLFGASDFTSRVPSALFSIATVFFAWWGYRKYLGRVGALVASFMMLISPYILFYGRYTRNESFIGLSMVVMVYAILRYMDTGRSRYFYIFTLAVCLHFISKETSFIYAAQALLFLAAFVIYQVLRKPWKDPSYMRTFLMGLVVGVIFLGIAAAGYAISKPPAAAVAPAVTPAAAGTQAAAAPAAPAAPLPWLAIIPGALAIIDLLVAGYFLLRGYGLAAIRRERSFDLLILLGTLVLPQLAAFPVKLFGWDPLDYTTVGIFRSGAVIVVLTLIAVGVGLWWRPRIWLACMGMFYAIFFTFYTTFFTNGAGIATGLMGALGYWLSQQGVNRGEQPLYFYALIQIPMYEYLPAVGAILAFLYTLRGAVPRLVSFLRGLPSLAMESPVEGEEEIPASAEALPEPGDGLPDGAPVLALTPADPPAALLPAEYPPVAPLLLYWAATSLLAFSVAGEKMPWLTVHITLPMILVSGWMFGHLIETTPWKRLFQHRFGLVLALLPVFFFALVSLVTSLTGAHPPFQGKELAQIEDTLTFLSAFAGVVGSLAGLMWLTRRWSGFELGRAFGLVFIALLAVQTVRTSIRSSYINYDTAKEYLVYAHAARGPKDALADVEEISRRTVGGQNIAVAYDNDTLYPFWWYFRDYPNKVYYADKPTHDLRNEPVVIVGQDNYDKVEPILGNNYVYYQTMRLWWPNQDYFNLTWDRIGAALTNPGIRAGIWNIWLNADYTQYAKATNNDKLTLTTWDPSNSMRVYIRKDIVSQIWKFGAVPAPLEVDPYAKGTVQLSADPVIGTAGSEAGQFQYPHGIAVAADGSLYVADSRNHRIQHLSADGKVLQIWGSFADISKGAAPGGTFNEPWDVAVAPDGSVFVADTWNNRIQKFSADGKFLKMWGVFGQAETPDAFWGPRGLAVSADRLFVTDTGNKRVVVFDLDGNPITAFGENGSDPGQLNEPVGVAVDAAGKVYVADTWNQRIQAFAPSSDGKTYTYLLQWDISGWVGQSLDNKPYLAVDQQGNVFATDPEGNRVLEFDNQGKFIRAWGDIGSDAKSFNLAGAVAIDAQGNVWVTDANNNRIMRFTLPK